MAAQSTATSQGRMLPGLISSIVGCLPPTFSRESSSTATCTGSRNPLCKSKISREQGNRTLVEVQETKKHSSAPAASEPSLCRDVQSHAQSNSGIGLGGRVRLMMRKALPDKGECVACTKQVRKSKLVTAPCGHIFCPRCLCKMGVIALQNIGRFPVRCCSQEIPVKKVASAMDSQRGEIYTSRAEEHAVPPAERWYCPHTTCGRWIAPRYIKTNSKTQTCPHCRAIICTSCHDLAHIDGGCAKDPALRPLLEMARRNHWQRCYNCHALVWKIDGCNHMRCRCGAHFCYICGRQRQTCHCRDSTVFLNNGGQTGEDDLDARTVVAGLEFAEQGENPPIHWEPWEMVLVQRAEQLQQQARRSRSPRAQPATHARRMPPTRVAIPTTTTSATMVTQRREHGRREYGTRVQATPRPVRHAQPRPGIFPSEYSQIQRSVRPVSRASGQSQFNRAMLTRPRRPVTPAMPAMPAMPVTPARPARPVRPTLSAMPLTPVRTAI